MGITVKILPIEYDENKDEKFRHITEFKSKTWVEGNNYWFSFLEDIFNINFVFSETDCIAVLLYNGRAEPLVVQESFFKDVKEKLNNGTYKKFILFQNEVNWDTFERILEIEDFFYKIFKNDSKFLFTRNIFKSRFSFTKIKNNFNFGCFPFQLLHNYNETLDFNYGSEKNFHLFTANCNIKEERLHLYQFLEKGNHWDKTNSSFFLPLFRYTNTKFNVKDFLSKHFLAANVGPQNKFVSNLGELDLDLNFSPRKMKYDKYNQVKNLALKDADESLFQLIFETRYHSHCGIVLSEKIFKGFLYKTPFIIFAQHGVLSLLKELGFKTFDWLIDERYDEEIDDGVRLAMILSEADKLLNMPVKKLNSIISANSDIFEHNHNMVKTFAYSELNKIFKMFYV